MNTNASFQHKDYITIRSWALPLLDDIYRHYPYFTSNSHSLTRKEWAYPILMRYPDLIKIDTTPLYEWWGDYVEANLDKLSEIGICMLNRATHTKAAKILEKHPDLVREGEEPFTPAVESPFYRIDWVTVYGDSDGIAQDWTQISADPTAVDLIKDNLDKVHGFMVAENPVVITYDYEKIRKERSVWLNLEEIIAAAYAPSKMQKWVLAGNDSLDYLQ